MLFQFANFVDVVGTHESSVVHGVDQSFGKQVLEVDIEWTGQAQIHELLFQIRWRGASDERVLFRWVERTAFDQIPKEHFCFHSGLCETKAQTRGESPLLTDAHRHRSVRKLDTAALIGNKIHGVSFFRVPVDSFASSYWLRYPGKGPQIMILPAFNSALVIGHAA